MEKIILAVREIREVLTQIALAESILDTLLFFFVTYLVCMLLTIDWRLGLVISLFYFAYHLTKKIRAIKLSNVEAAVPELKEQLSTSADNIHMDNEIVQLLHLDVLSKMRNIKVSMFIPYKKLWREVMSIAAIAFLVLILASLNVQFLDYKNVLKGFSQKEVTRPDQMQNLASTENITGGKRHIGNESIAELGTVIS